MHGRIITVASDKGGVGKTTAATAVAQGLARGHPAGAARVLLVDFDLLGQDAIVLGMEPAAGVYQHFVLAAPAAETIQATGRPGLELLPGDSWTRAADVALRSRPFDELQARVAALAAGYDFVVIDTHPSGLLQEAALAVADVLIVPVRLEALALDAVAATLQLAQEVGKPEQMLILPTLYDSRLVEQRYNLELLRTAYPGVVATPVPSCVAVTAAHAAGRTVWEFKDRGGRLAAVRAAYEHLLQRLTTTISDTLVAQETTT